MISSKALEFDTDEQFKQEWEEICDRYDSQLDKIAKGIGLEDFTSECIIQTYKMFETDHELYKGWNQRTALNIEDIKEALAMEKELIAQKTERFTKVLEEVQEIDPKPIYEDAQGRI